MRWWFFGNLVFWVERLEGFWEAALTGHLENPPQLPLDPPAPLSGRVLGEGGRRLGGRMRGEDERRV